jgi:hypothetical protein
VGAVEARQKAEKRAEPETVTDAPHWVLQGVGAVPVSPVSALSIPTVVPHPGTKPASANARKTAMDVAAKERLKVAKRAA